MGHTKRHRVYQLAFQGYSIQEIAEETRLTTETVTNLIKQVAAALDTAQ